MEDTQRARYWAGVGGEVRCGAWNVHPLPWVSDSPSTSVCSAAWMVSGSFFPEPSNGTMWGSLGVSSLELARFHKKEPSSFKPRVKLQPGG